MRGRCGEARCFCSRSSHAAPRPHSPVRARPVNLPQPPGTRHRARAGLPLRFQPGIAPRRAARSRTPGRLGGGRARRERAAAVRNGRLRLGGSRHGEKRVTTAARGAAMGRAAAVKSGRPRLGGSRRGEKRMTTAGSERPQQGAGGVAGSGRPRRRRAWAQRRTVAARRRMSRHSGERATTAGSGRRCWERAALLGAGGCG